MKYKLIVLVLVLFLCACNSEKPEVKDPKLETYKIALDLGYKGSLFRWLQIIDSDQQMPKDNVEIKIENNLIYWKNQGEDKYSYLISLTDMVNPDRDNDRNVEFSIDETELLWRYSEDVAWNSLITLSNLVLFRNSEVTVEPLYQYRDHNLYCKMPDDIYYRELIVDITLQNSHARESVTKTLTLDNEITTLGYPLFNSCDQYLFTPDYSSRYVFSVSNCKLYLYQEENIIAYGRSCIEVTLTKNNKYRLEVSNNDKIVFQTVRVSLVALNYIKNLNVKSYLGNNDETILMIKPQKKDIYKLSIIMSTSYQIDAGMISILDKDFKPVVGYGRTPGIPIINQKDVNNIFAFLNDEINYLVLNTRYHDIDIYLTLETLGETNNSLLWNEDGAIQLGERGVLSSNYYILNNSEDKKVRISCKVNADNFDGYILLYRIIDGIPALISGSKINTVVDSTRILTAGDYYIGYLVNSYNSCGVLEMSIIEIN